MKRKFTKLMAALALLVCMTPSMVAWGQTRTTVDDVLEASSFTATTTTYTNFSGVSFTSDAVYAGNSAKTSSGGIQLRSKNNSGIVSTTSGGTIHSVAITVESGSNTLDIYGKNTAYTAASDLYAAATQGTKIGSISATGTVDLGQYVDQYSYIGIRSNNNAIYLTSITVTWTVPSATHQLTFSANPDGGGSLAIGDNLTSPANVAEGATLNIVATANTGYEFSNWSYTGEGSSVATATNASTTFTMGTENATLTANFTSVPTHTITYKANYTGSSEADVTQTFNEGANATIAACPFTYTGHVSTKWNTNADGTGTSYLPGATIENIQENIVLYAQWVDATVDVLNKAFTGDPSNYTSWSGKTGTSGAVYAGNSSGSNNSIQLRGSDNSGIVTTASGGLVKKVVVTWESHTANSRTLQVYGKNTAYASAADLYNASTQGTLLGEIVKGTSTELTITGDYNYIGLRSKENAMFLSEIDITWAPDEYSTTVTIDASGLTNTNVFGGTAAGTLAATVKHGNTPIDGASVTWSSSDPTVATIDENDGAVTLVAAGTTTITANYAGVLNGYKPSSATYELTVTNVNPDAAGTRSNPYTVAEALTLINGWDNNTTSASDVYVSGIVCNVAQFYENYHSISYSISDNGENNSALYVYGGMSVNGADFSAVTDLAIGNQVIVKGKLKKHVSNETTTPEFTSGNKLVLLVHSNTYSKAIEGYGENAGGYYLVASPVDIQDPTTAMTTGDYDLYYFDQAQTLEWRNYEATPFNLTAGKGYLYANSANTVITVTGTPTETTATMAKTENAESEGMNLVGNPLGTKAYIGRPFYIMNSEGTELILSSRDYIFPMEGVFVSAVIDGETLTFNNVAPDVNPGKGNLNIQVAQVVSSRGTTPAIDRAMISFNGNDMLPKFQLNPNSTKVYIPQGNKDYAVVRSNGQGEMPVNFKASKNGTYTLSINPENVELNYLHLIDNLTGADVDLLAEPSYTFSAKTSDYASRFRLVFSGSSTSSETAETFAYFNGSEWVVSNSGNATLQIVDMLGRVVSSENLNGNATISTNGLSNGVYVMRLVNGENVKTQKIVVR